MWNDDSLVLSVTRLIEEVLTSGVTVTNRLLVVPLESLSPGVMLLHFLKIIFPTKKSEKTPKNQ